MLQLSKEAALLSAKFAQWLEPKLIGDLGDIADFAGKLHGAIIRISGILHLAVGHTGAKKITSSTMSRAIKLGSYFLQHAKIAYQYMGADKQLQDANCILHQIKKKEYDKLRGYDILRLCRPWYAGLESGTLFQPFLRFSHEQSSCYRFLLT